MSRDEAARELCAVGWAGVAEDVLDGVGIAALLRGLHEDGRSEAAGIIVMIDED